MFKKVTGVAEFHKKDFKHADNIPSNYNLRPFLLDGKVELDVTFHGQIMRTGVYVKMDAA